MAYIFEFLEQFHRLMLSFMGYFSEAALRENRCIAYEILDEIIDAGYIGRTTAAALKIFVASDPIPRGPRNEAPAGEWKLHRPAQSLASIAGRSALEERHPNIVTPQTSSKAVKPCGAEVRKRVNLLPHHPSTQIIQRCRKISNRGRLNRIRPWGAANSLSHQVFVDFAETVSAAFQFNSGLPRRAEVAGTLAVRSFGCGGCAVKISLPEILVHGEDQDAARLRGDAHAIALSAYVLGDAVDRAAWRANRTLEFDAPDGIDVDVLRYRTTQNVAIPLTVVVRKHIEDHVVTLNVNLTGTAGARATFDFINVTIPVPGRDIRRATFTAGTAGADVHGRCTYHAHGNHLAWDVGVLGGAGAAQLVCTLTVAAGADPQKVARSIRGATLTFAAKHFSASRLSTKAVEVTSELAGGTADPPRRWMRHSVSAGSYTAAFQ